MRTTALALACALCACGGSSAPAPAKAKSSAGEPAEAQGEAPAPSEASPPTTEAEASAGAATYGGAPPCPAPPEWLTIDPAKATGLPGDEIEFTVAVAGGVGRLAGQNQWLQIDPDAEPAPRATGTVVVNEHTHTFRGAVLEAERGDEAQTIRCAQPEVRLKAPALDGLEAEQRRDVTDVAFHGGVVSVAGDTISFSYTDGLEENDCGHHVVPVSTHWVREAPDTGRLYIAVEDRKGGEECTEDPVTPRVIAQAPLPDDVTQVHVIFDLVRAEDRGNTPYVRHETTIPVAAETHVLSPR